MKKSMQIEVDPSLVGDERPHSCKRFVCEAIEVPTVGKGLCVEPSKSP